MTQTAMSFDRPAPRDLFKEGSQNYRIYSLLLQGPITNGDILFGLRIANSTGRISDIREKLRPYLMDVKSEPIPGTSGAWLYRLAG